MITKSAGFFELSLDGGKTFVGKHNLLLTGFYLAPTGTLTCQVGESDSAVAFNNSVITAPLTSSAGTLVSTTNVYDAATNEIVIKSQYNFDFVSNITKTIAEIGIRLGTTLVSRALFEAAINVTAIDVLVVRYTLITRIPMTPYPVTIELGDIEYSGTALVCNPNQWEQLSFGSLKPSAKYAVLVNGTYSVGSDGYLTGVGSLVASYSTTITETGTANSKIAAVTVSTGLESTEQTFNVFAICDAASSVANQMLMLIIFDSTVTRTIDDIIHISMTIPQVPA